ncbi:lysophospholipid acyltransferase family protein [Kaarinaea lacus]
MRSLFAILLLRLVSLFPLPVVHAMGRAFGSILYFSKNDLKKITRMNIHLCFPELNKQQQDELVRDALKHVGMAMLECGPLWFWPVEKVMGLIKGISGRELLENAMKQNNGVILAAPHLGAWEIIGLYCPRYWPMTILFRAPRSQRMERLLYEVRQRGGTTLVPAGAAGVRELRKALSRNELIGILPDQDPGAGSGVFAPFFGIQANTMNLVSRLASKTGATVLMTYAERLPKGQGYHIHFSASPGCMADDDPVVATTCMNKVVEDCVRKLPAQYQWAYRRFKTRPEGEVRMYSPRRKDFLDLD